MYTEDTVTQTKQINEKIVETGLMHQPGLIKQAGIKMGYGNCTHNGCICPAFDGSGELCANCGHNYSYHN